jgi:hypothetical protein
VLYESSIIYDLTLPVYQPFNLHIMLYKPSIIRDLTCKI